MTGYIVLRDSVMLCYATVCHMNETCCVVLCYVMLRYGVVRHGAVSYNMSADLAAVVGDVDVLHAPHDLPAGERILGWAGTPRVGGDQFA